MVVYQCLLCDALSSNNACICKLNIDTYINMIYNSVAEAHVKFFFWIGFGEIEYLS